MEFKILDFLQKILGNSKETSKGNHAYHCPFCNHSKKKLEIHPITGNWHCWVCHKAGRNLFQLLKKLNVNKTKFDELKSILPSSVQVKKYLENKTSTEKIVNLPKEYKPLWVRDRSFSYMTCIQYLFSRGITLKDIFKYRLGYCESGRYAGMIIFPNLNSNGDVNYFTTRSYLRSSRVKFINPPYSKNIIGFEFQTNFSLPIVLVESALDAIVYRRNAIPLYGTHLQSKLKEKLIDSETKSVTLILDPDAISHAYKIASDLENIGIATTIVNLPENEDINSIGFENIWHYTNKKVEYTPTDDFKLKILQLI